MTASDDLDKLIEGLLSEDEARDPALVAAAAGVLLSRQHGASPSQGDPTARMAAWLDGAMDANERAAFEAELADAQGAFHDLEAADLLLTRAAEERQAPADLVAGVLAQPLVSRPAFNLFIVLRRIFAGLLARPVWAGGGFATAALALAAVMIMPQDAVAPVPGSSTPGFSVSGAQAWPTPMEPMADTAANVGFHDPCAASAADATPSDMRSAQEKSLSATSCDPTASGTFSADVASPPESPFFDGLAAGSAPMAASPQQ